MVLGNVFYALQAITSQALTTAADLLLVVSGAVDSMASSINPQEFSSSTIPLDHEDFGFVVISIENNDITSHITDNTIYSV